MLFVHNGEKFEGTFFWRVLGTSLMSKYHRKRDNECLASIGGQTGWGGRRAYMHQALILCRRYSKMGNRTSRKTRNKKHIGNSGTDTYIQEIRREWKKDKKRNRHVQ